MQALLLLASAAAVLAGAPLVQVGVYYESYCPDSIAFVTTQLWPAWQDTGVPAIMNVTMVPYGKCQENYNGTAWEFNCQHGDEECFGNTFTSCVMSHVGDIASYLPFINCIESADDPDSALQGCCQQSGIDFDTMNDCANGMEGNTLEHAMGLLTEALNPSIFVTGVPVITINGEESPDAEYNFLPDVCGNYTGTPKPQACSNAVRRPRPAHRASEKATKSGRRGWVARP